jgi:acyl carrier protein
MTRDALPEIFAALRTVAPEIDPAAIERSAVLVETLDLDSMDFLRFLEALSDRLGVDIPEADYPQVRTLDQIVAYLSRRAASEPVPPGTTAPGR